MHRAGARRTVHILWSSRALFVLAATGAVIGFHSFTQFPALVRAHGGGAFLLVYLFWALLLGLPLLAAQLMLARLGRDAPDGVFSHAAAHSRATRRWGIVGVVAVLAGFLMFCYLSVIAGWMIAFGQRAATGALSGLTADGIGHQVRLLVEDPEKQLFWYSLFVGSVALVSSRGLRAGLEPAIRYLVPLLFGLMLALLLFAAASGGFSTAMREMFAPDFSRLSLTAVLAAALHAVFSLGLGASAMFMCGAYLDRDASLPRVSGTIVALDTVAGVMGALIVFALLSAGGVELEPGLAVLFKSLPLAFDHLAGGRVLLPVYFVMLILIAWLAGVALFESAVMWVVERFEWRRAPAALMCGGVAWLVGLVLLLSFNVWKFPFHFFGEIKQRGFFDMVLILTDRGLLPLVGIGTALFAGWVFKLETAREQLHLRSPCAFDAWVWLTRLVIPIVLVSVAFQLAYLTA